MEDHCIVFDHRAKLARTWFTRDRRMLLIAGMDRILA